MKKKAIIIAALLGVAGITSAPVFAQTTSVASQTAKVTPEEVIRQIAKAAGISEPISDAQLASLLPPRSEGAEKLYQLLVKKARLQANTLDALLNAAAADQPVTNLLVATALIEFKTGKPVDTNALADFLNSHPEIDFNSIGDIRSFLVANNNSAVVRTLLLGVSPR